MRVLRNSFRRPIAHLFTMLALVATHLFSVAQSPLLPVNSFPASTPVGQTSAAISVAVRFIANGSPVAPQVVTQGAAGGDFAVVPGGTCTAGVSYFAAQQCTVNVVFQPKFPGLRSGAVQLLSGSGSLLGSALVAGSATGALAVLPAGQIDDVAGAIEWLYRGDGVPANGAPIFLPMGVTEDAAGNIYIADSNNYRIRRVDAQSGLISTIAGDGSPGYSGDGGPARQAMISTPAGLALDGAGNLYFADTGNHCIRRIDAISQTISTVAGTGGQQGLLRRQRRSHSRAARLPAVGRLRHRRRPAYS